MLKGTPLTRHKPLGRYKTAKPRKALRKKSKEPISKIQRRIWELCKQIIRKKHGNICYTCDATGLVGSNWHTSHFIPKAACGALLKYDLRNLRPSCYHCNINLGGNGAEFYRRLVRDVGQEEVDKIYQDKNKLVKADYKFYEDILNRYTVLLGNMDTNQGS